MLNVVVFIFMDQLIILCFLFVVYTFLYFISRGIYDGEKVAVKQVRNEIIKNDIELAKNEVDKLKKADHPNVVQYKFAVSFL